MTLQDLIRLLKRNWVFSFILTLALSFVCAAYLYMQPTLYTATSQVLVVESEDNNALGIMEACATEYVPEGQNVAFYADHTKDAFVITVTGESSAGSAQVSSDLADNVMAKAEEMLPGTSYLKIEAGAMPVSRKSYDLVLVAALAGLFLSGFLVTLKDASRQTIKSARDVSSLVDYPLLGKVVSGDDLLAERLYANVRFTMGEGSVLCLVPVGGAASILETAKSLIERGEVISGSDALTEAADRSDFDRFSFERKLMLWSAPGYRVSNNASYLANKADAVVLVIGSWVSTAPELQETIHELSLASANIVGYVLGE